MSSKSSITLLFLILLWGLPIYMLPAGEAVAQHTSSSTEASIHTFPAAGSTQVPTNASLSITSRYWIDPASLTSGRFIVIGEKSGNHLGRMSPSIDGKSVLFSPFNPFEPSETVTVLIRGITAGETPGSTKLHAFILSDTFSFQTASAYSDRLLSYWPSPDFAGGLPAWGLRQPTDLPGIYPTIDNNPTPGRIFVATTGGPPEFSNLVCLDEHGVPIFYAAIPGATGFTLQPNGEMTYFSAYDGKYYGLDSNGFPTRTYGCANGIIADGHELLVFKDGGYSILGWTHTTMDMKHYVSAGDTDADVLGGVIQTFDKNDSLTFEWRGIDHYNLLDARHADLGASSIDFEHANSIDIDAAGNYLLSNRNLDEVTKIDPTGKIVWRFGGLHNQFTIMGDSLGGFNNQHCARWLPDNHVILFDNGGDHATPQSRAVEYELDESAMTAKLIWEYRRIPPTFSSYLGSVERLPNGNTFIGWGQDSAVAVSEVQMDGTVVFEMHFEFPVISYRAFKNPSPFVGAVLRKSGIASDFDVFQSTGGYDVRFETPDPATVSVRLVDVLGQTVALPFDGRSIGGVQRIHIPTSKLVNGHYFCLVSTSEGRGVRPISVFH